MDCASPYGPNAGGYKEAGQNCGDNRPVRFSAAITPCLIAPAIYNEDHPYIGNEGASGSFLSGYKEDSPDWWFLEDPSWDSFVSSAVEVDPYADTGMPHTLIGHFSMYTKLIKCCAWNSACNGNGSKSSNWATYGASCGSSTSKHLEDDKEQRERSVRIYAFAGFTADYCGLSPSSVCQKQYDLPL
jgi:hypothetical protein